jgi:hypothetical protein
MLLFPIPYSLFLIPYSLFPVPCSLSFVAASQGRYAATLLPAPDPFPRMRQAGRKAPKLARRETDEKSSV